MEYKFKAGDKVRRLTESRNPNKWGIKGDTYMVNTVHDWRHGQTLILTGLEADHGGADAVFFQLVVDILPEELFVL